MHFMHGRAYFWRPPPKFGLANISHFFTRGLAGGLVRKSLVRKADVRFGDVSFGEFMVSFTGVEGSLSVVSGQLGVLVSAWSAETQGNRWLLNTCSCSLFRWGSADFSIFFWRWAGRSAG